VPDAKRPKRFIICFIARMKRLIRVPQYEGLRERYQECVRMLNGIERSLERKLPKDQQRWPFPEP
jgi:hypothetical protein